MRGSAHEVGVWCSGINIAGVLGMLGDILVLHETQRGDRTKGLQPLV